MKKVNLFVLAALLAFPFSSFAEKVSLKLISLKTGYVEGMGKISISPVEGGNLRVTVDPNVCRPNGGGCTKMAAHSEVVEPKVIRDSRPVDGDLLLALTPELSLSVGSGYNIEERIEYTVLMKKSDSSRVLSAPMTADVFLKVR